uniref:Uncharacterized protein n=1 Tax=Kalanchoe fedtschenkoi TaxID=63787 RepID=A0A7N0V137_KALFE
MESDEKEEDRNQKRNSGDVDGQRSAMEAADSGKADVGSSEVSRVSGIDLNVVPAERGSEIGFSEEGGLAEVNGIGGGSGGWEEFCSGKDLGGGREVKKGEVGKAAEAGLLAPMWSDSDLKSAAETLLSLSKPCSFGLQSVPNKPDSMSTGSEDVLLSDAEAIGAPEVLGSTQQFDWWLKEARERSAAYAHRSVISFARRVHEEARDSANSNTSCKKVEECRNFSGPFATAFRKLEDELDKLQSKGQPLVEWEPAEEQNHRHVPSLVDLSMAVIAKNSNLVSSLEYVPHELRERLTSLICDYKKLDSNFMKLLASGSPEEIIVKDCSWMTIEQFHQIFRSFDAKNLRVLRLELCGQCMFDDMLKDAFSWSPVKLYALATISLKGAAGLTDEGLKSLTLLAPSLKSINLSLCSLITAHGIHKLANVYASTLKELYIDECPKIDAVLVLPALMELKNLEVLSVAGIPTVTDEFVEQIAVACGVNLKELRLADCGSLTDKSMEVIGAKCPSLAFLDLSNLDMLTDFSLLYITNSCQSLRHLKLHRNRFSDKALGAFLEVSGKSLTELSLNGVGKIGAATALAIARYTRGLVSLDLSWCRSLSDKMVGLIVDSCKSLVLLKLFGCGQVKSLTILQKCSTDLLKDSNEYCSFSRKASYCTT